MGVRERDRRSTTRRREPPSKRVISQSRTLWSLGDRTARHRRTIAHRTSTLRVVGDSQQVSRPLRIQRQPHISRIRRTLGIRRAITISLRVPTSKREPLTNQTPRIRGNSEINPVSLRLITRHRPTRRTVPVERHHIRVERPLRIQREISRLAMGVRERDRRSTTRRREPTGECETSPCCGV